MSGGIGRYRALSLVAAAAASSAASAAAVQPSSNRTEILFLGTAGGPPLRVDRSEPSTLLIVNGREYLIDCGIGTARRLVEAGIASSRIKTIFFTHLHADHDMGLADVMANDFFEGGGSGTAGQFDIYGPPQTGELVDAAFKFISVGFRPFAAAPPTAYRMRGGNFISAFTAHEISRDGVVFDDGNIRVTAAENSHYVMIPAGTRSGFKTYSYRVQTPDGVIVFSGDTGPSGSITTVTKGADVLIAEASYRDPADLNQSINARAARNHWSPLITKRFRDHFVNEHLDTAEIGQIAANAGAKAVALYHYDPADEADQAAYVSGVRKYFPGPVFAPNDLDRYCLSSGAISRCAGRPLTSTQLRPAVNVNR
jgi:ribonuclease BN (tRNA processing enzyme)